jgi:hypothetical protein
MGNGLQLVRTAVWKLNELPRGHVRIGELILFIHETGIHVLLW